MSTIRATQIHYSRPRLVDLAFVKPGLGLVLMIACINCTLEAGTHEMRVGEVGLLVEMDEKIRASDDGYPWTDWLAKTLQAASTITGTFPRDNVRIKLRASSGSSSPISFGQVRRSDPLELRFYVSPGATLQGLTGDWRGYHEFAHLLIPFPGNDDIWFTEGFASYYQYLLQSRAGVISQREAWQELMDGFARGESDRSGRNRSLRNLSPDMWRERAYKRVYWTGAAFFLRVDVRLRTESGGTHSLDSALAAFHACCLYSRTRWNARQLVDALGDNSIPEIWRQEYLRTINAPAVPRYAEALDRLGIQGNRSNLRFDDDAAIKALRTAIAGGRRVPAGFDRIVGHGGPPHSPSSTSP